ncbi:MAG: hypothetical protein PWR01_2808 [Clostridiales bacterium]|jgi:surface antigen|nr:hypothetical protein [Clostridiales bacterium]MDN5281735.1 hypothetical protein [Candidatus Ozemobacter sp.]
MKLGYKNSNNFHSSRLCRIILLVLFFFLFAISAHAAAWKLSRSFWTDEDEKTYADFVEKLGSSKHSNLNRFIRDAKANPLYGEEDKKFNLYPDCADLPYLLRAYVAYKLRLPFSYVSAISSKGGDQRYGRGNRPTDFKDQDYFSSPQQLFSKVTLINSGYYRMSPEVENSDHYPVKIQPESIKPGTIYYDPDGHVAVVAKVTPDGRIRVIDAHPDRTISKPWFGAKFTRGSSKNGGGFKRWRPLRYTSDGKVRRTSNHNIVDFSATDQYQKKYSYRGRTGVSYYEYIRMRLANDKSRLDPLSDFRFMMSDLYEDICYRSVAVNLCIEKGINKRPHPGSLPWNIYGTDGIWEEFSTPSRDARLKVAFKDFYDRSCQMILESYRSNPAEAFKLASAMLEAYESLSQRFSITYTDSAGNVRLLNFDAVAERLFLLSFDPYHSIEYRWGGSPEELALSPDDHTKKRFYELEQRLRNQLERVYNQPTPLSMGPERPPEIRVKKMLLDFLEGQKLPQASIIASHNAVQPSYPPGQSPAEIQKRKELQLAANTASVQKVQIAQESANSSDLEKTNDKAEILPETELASLNVSEIKTVTRVGLKEFFVDLMRVGDNLAGALLKNGSESGEKNMP